MRLIDADELKKPVGSYNPVKFTHEYGYVIRLEDIDHAPTVDPVKHGRWKKAYADHEAFGERPFYRYCSECCEVAVFPYKFCPNCGASMESMDEVSE